jgi:hypothetical protein
MRARYFLVEESGELRKAAQAAVEGAWQGHRPLDDISGTRNLGIVTVLCDDSYRPLQCFMARVRVVDGRITDESRDQACHAWFLLRPPLEIPGTPPAPRDDPRLHPSVLFQVSGWPPTDRLRRQLAVALDVPLELVPDDLYIGGPLIAAVQVAITIRQAMTYFPARAPEEE